MELNIRRAVRVSRHLMRASITAQMQYRVDFLIQLGMALFWSIWHLLPLWLVFQLRETIAGFRFEEAALVLSAFLILKSVLEGLVNPNMALVVDHVRRGTLDFVLLKPVDSQLLVSVSRVLPSKAVDLAWGLGLGLWALGRLEPAPPPAAIAAGLAMLLTAVALLYALWLLVICTAFWFVRIDNLAFLFASIFDAGRWPVSVFRGWVRAVLTFVLPVALMTSYPALATLGRLDASTAAVAVALAVGFLVLSRVTWRWALSHYASASS